MLVCAPPTSSSCITASRRDETVVQRHGGHVVRVPCSLESAVLVRLGAAVVPFYAARVSDLGPGDLVQVECVCGHTERLTAAMLTTAGLAPDERVRGLESRMRCRECDEKGRAVISIPGHLRVCV